MQSTRNTRIDLKGGLFHERGAYPLLLYFNASSKGDKEIQVSISCIDFNSTLPQHSAVFCMSAKSVMTCMARGFADF